MISLECRSYKFEIIVLSLQFPDSCVAFWATMAAAQIAKKLKDKRQKNYIEGIFRKVSYYPRISS